MESIISFVDNISLEEIVYFFFNPKFEGWLLYVQIAFIFISLCLLTASVVLFMSSSWFRRRYSEEWSEFLTFSPSGKVKTNKAWNKITKRMGTKKEAQYKLAIIEADSLLDNNLKIMGYHGETIAERIRRVESQMLSDKEKIFRAHDVRNRIVQDPNYPLDFNEAEKTIDIYKEVFKEIGVL